MMPATASRAPADTFVDFAARAAELRAAITARCPAKAQPFVKASAATLSGQPGRETLALTIPTHWHEWRDEYGDAIYRVGCEVCRQVGYVFRIHRQPAPRVMRGAQ